MAIPKKAFPSGVHAPSFTFFATDSRQQIDWDTQDRHLSYLIKSSLPGVVVAGTCGEAAALTLDETRQLTTRTRELAAQHGRSQLTITSGCLGQCTREVIDRTYVAYESGADFALVLPPAAFAFALNQPAIISFYTEVASASPIPVVIYNFPDVVNGLNLSSETLATLGQHENICAVKLTCGGIAKAATTAALSHANSFAALAGQADWLLPALSIGAIGCVAGVANLFPRTLLRIHHLYSEGDIVAAAELQKRVSKMELGFAKGGLAGSKWIIVKMLQYSEGNADCRRPIPPFTNLESMEYITKLVAELIPLEKELEQLGKRA